MGNFILGLDLGQARDYSAAVLVERVQAFDHWQEALFAGDGHWTEPDGYWAGPERDRRVYDEYHVVRLQRWPLGTPYVNIVDEVCDLLTSPALGRYCRLVVDYTGVGRAVGELFTQARRHHRLIRWPYLLTITGGFASGNSDEDEESAVHKGDLVSVVQTATARRRLKLSPELPLADTLQKEMRAFRVKQNARTGNVGWEAERESDHDDLVIALALALWGRHGYGCPRYVREDGVIEERASAIATNPQA